MSPPILRGIIENAQPRGLQAYSATELAGCPRQVILKDQEPYDIEPSRAYWLFRGQLGHKIVEEYTHGEAIVERRFHAPLSGMLLTGQPDVVYPERGVVVDYKTTKRVPQRRKVYACPECEVVLRDGQWKARKGTLLDCPECGAAWDAHDIGYHYAPARPYDSHIIQLSIYRWLLAQNDVAVDAGEIVYLSMAQTLRLSVELWPVEQTATYLSKRVAGLLETGPDHLPYGIWDNPDEKWRCTYCDVKPACIKQYLKQGLHEAVAALS
jgi:predicted RNA-binding Zn-ribbon protein involved in translation (DUF1610 family)